MALGLNPDAYKVFKERDRTREYDLFASDYYSKPFIKAITRGLQDYAKEVGLGDAEVPHFIVSFVQNMPYTSDDVTTGFDEYPRFPYETFYDNGGDCEDTSILASAMLHELGYDVALLRFPGHMAVGIECRPSAGQSYYTHQGIRYCYLETTGENWEIGMVPASVQGSPATVSPIIERPVLEIEFTAEYRTVGDTVTVDVDVSVNNVGSKTARGGFVYVALRRPGTNRVWDKIESRKFQLEPEASYLYQVTNLRVPAGKSFNIYARAGGRNLIGDEAVSDLLR